MFDQLTSKTISVSLKAYKKVILNSNEYSFVKTKPEFYFGWQDIEIDNSIVHIATAEKALIDIVNFRKSQYSLDLVFEKLIENRQNLDFDKFDDYLARLSLATIKIFGLVFDIIGIKSNKLLIKVIASRSTHKMLPDDNKFNSKWRLYYDPYFDKYR